MALTPHSFAVDSLLLVTGPVVTGPVFAITLTTKSNSGAVYGQKTFSTGNPEEILDSLRAYAYANLQKKQQVCDLKTNCKQITRQPEMLKKRSLHGLTDPFRFGPYWFNMNSWFGLEQLASRNSA